jgi:hypothetical protein
MSTAPDLQWRTSSASANTNCVEVALGQLVHVRDSKDRGLGSLVFDPDAWAAFIGAVRGGDFRR